jgi:AcrR family transcriptional regulator
MTKRRTIKTRKKQSREEIIEDILQIAREMMQKDGVGALSFNAIARELGIKPPSLYTYFESKYAIYDALFRRGFLILDGMIKKAEGDTFDEKLASIFRTYMTFAHENPDLFQIIFERPIPDFEPSNESMAISWKALEDSQRTLRDLLESEMIDPGFPLEQATDLIIAMMHGLTSMKMANHPDLLVGEGRFGVIIDHAAGIFARAWTANKDSNIKG